MLFYIIVFLVITAMSLYWPREKPPTCWGYKPGFFERLEIKRKKKEDAEFWARVKATGERNAAIKAAALQAMREAQPTMKPSTRRKDIYVVK